MATRSVSEFYGHDVIYRFTKRKRIQFGVVMDTYEHCDDSQLLRKGQVLVYWLNRHFLDSQEQVIRQNKVKILSRLITDGDIVRRLEDGKETQRGYCRGFSMQSVVHIIGSNTVVENVDNNRFGFVHPFELGVPVCFGHRFGRVLNCEYSVKLSSKDGSVVEFLPENNKPRLRDRTFDDAEYSLTEYHVGSVKNLVPGKLKHAKWLKKSRTIKQNFYKSHLFIVQKITPVEVTINVHSMRGQPNYQHIVPKSEIPIIKILKTFQAAVPSYYEPRSVAIHKSDSILPKRNWLLKQSAHHLPDYWSEKRLRKCTSTPPIRYTSIINALGIRRKKKTCGLRRPRLFKTEDSEEDKDWTTDDDDEDAELQRIRRKKAFRPGNTVVVEALCTSAKSTVVWQDGTVEKDINSSELYYSVSLDDQEFFPGECVLRADGMLGTYGVVQKVNYIERTTLVKWFKFDPDTDKSPTYSHKREMSVYDIKRHPTYVFRPGSVVYRHATCRDNLGLVIDSFPEGYVRVKWLNGKSEDCWPFKLGILPEYGMEEIEDIEEDDTDIPTWDTESEESILGGVPEPSWTTLAARLEFIRSRIGYIRDAFIKVGPMQTESFPILKTLLSVYENSAYLDRLLGTQFFSYRSSHYLALLEKIKTLAIKSGEKLQVCKKVHSTIEAADMDSISKVMDLESSVPLVLFECSSDATLGLEVGSTEFKELAAKAEPSLCFELISMLKCRLDLSFAEMIDRMSGTQGAISVIATSTPVRSFSTSGESFTSITSTPVKPEENSSVHSAAKTPDKEELVDSPSLLASETPSNTTQEVQSEEVSIAIQPPSVEAPKEVEVSEDIPEPQIIFKVPDERKVLKATRTRKISTVDNLTKLKPFVVVDEALPSHRFFSNMFEPVDRHSYRRAVMFEQRMLKGSLPPGVSVYSFLDRIDLYSVMICGPDKTPYENGLFIFDLQLGAEYPRTPPQCHYISYNCERLNPNLYVEGKVCVSLLGTWMGRGTEVWGPRSTLLQLIVSIQGLILVAEPYYNEAGFEKQCKSQQGVENSRTYNELVILRLVQSMTDMMESPHEVFREEIYKHFRENGEKLYHRLSGWIDGTNLKEPDFPLLPVSKGLKLSLRTHLDKFKQVLDKHASS